MPQLARLYLYCVGDAELEAMEEAALTYLEICVFELGQAEKLAQLRSLTHLSVQDGIDPGLLSPMSWLRELELGMGCYGRLRLPAGPERLDVRAELELELEPDSALRELACNQAGLRSLPAAAREQIERLSFTLEHGLDDRCVLEELAELFLGSSTSSSSTTPSGLGTAPSS